MGLSGVGLTAAERYSSFMTCKEWSITRGEYEKLLDKTDNILRSKGRQVKEIV